MSAPHANGIVTLQAAGTVDATVEKLKALLREKGVKLFAVIDHSGEAQSAGLQMPSTKLVIFGNPKAGTPLMLAAPEIALDLPLKILIAQGPDGATQVSYMSPEYLMGRFHAPAEFLSNLAVIAMLAAQAAL